MSRSSVRRDRFLVLAAIAVAGAGALAVACSPRSRDLARMQPTGSAIDASYDHARSRVWTAVIEVLADRGASVTVADEERGVIVTEFAYAGAAEDELACTGVSTGGGEWVSGVRYRFHIRVTAAGPRSTVVRVYADVQVQESSPGGEGAWVDCASTGEVERSLLDRIAARVTR